jgi:DNA-binding MarR family transcriptional regulator
MQIMENFEHIYTQKIDIDGTILKADLRESQIKVLFAFDDGHCFSMKELADNLGVRASNMTRIIDSLIKDGIVEEGKDDKDRRQVKVRLTPHGEKIRAQFVAHQHKVAETIYVRLNDKDKVTLLNSLDTACKILKKIS